MFHAGGDDINPCCIDAAVAQNIRQLGDVLFDAVKCPGKQLSQVVGKHLAFLDTGSFTPLFHLPPDTTAVQGLAVFADKDRASCDAAAFGIIQQDIFQLTRNEDCPGFTFAVDCDLTTTHRLNGEELQLRYPDTGTTDGLEYQIQLFVFLRS